MLLLIDLYILLFPVNTEKDIVSFDQFPMAYNNSPTSPGVSCIDDSDGLTCRDCELLGDGDFGSADLNTSKVLAWNREINIVPSGVGLPPVELYWSSTSIFPQLPENLLSHVIVGNQDLSEDDRTLRNVSLVVTNQFNYLVTTTQQLIRIS